MEWPTSQPSSQCCTLHDLTWTICRPQKPMSRAQPSRQLGMRTRIEKSLASYVVDYDFDDREMSHGGFIRSRGITMTVSRCSECLSCSKRRSLKRERLSGLSIIWKLINSHAIRVCLIWQGSSVNLEEKRAKHQSLRYSALQRHCFRQLTTNGNGLGPLVEIWLEPL